MLEIKNTCCSALVSIHQILICVRWFPKTNHCCLSWSWVVRTNKAGGKWKRLEPEEFNRQPEIKRTDDLSLPSKIGQMILWKEEDY